MQRADQLIMPMLAKEKEGAHNDFFCINIDAPVTDSSFVVECV